MHTQRVFTYIKYYTYYTHTHTHHTQALAKRMYPPPLHILVPPFSLRVVAAHHTHTHAHTCTHTFISWSPPLFLRAAAAICSCTEICGSMTRSLNSSRLARRLYRFSVYSYLFRCTPTHPLNNAFECVFVLIMSVCVCVMRVCVSVFASVCASESQTPPTPPFV